MKRTVLAVILIFGAFFCAYGQNTSPIDLVLLLDTSSSMSSSYEHVNNYVTGAFLNEFLRVGDTFHLIVFSANQRLDIARRISGIGDVETIIGRMLLQYPVESGNNIGSAITFAEQYITSLPSRPKKIVLVTVGGSDTNNLVNASKQRLNSRNTTLDYIQVTPGRPITNAPSSGRPAPARTAASTQQPAQTSSAAGQAQTTGTITTGTTGQGAASTAGTTTGTTSIGTTGTTTTGTTDQSAGTSPEQDWELITSETSDSSDRQDVRESFASSLPLIILIIIGILLLLALILLLSSRRLGSSPNRVMAAVSSSGSKKQKEETAFADHSKDLATYAAGSSRRSTPYDDRKAKEEKVKQPVINPAGPLLLNLYVEDQNTAIGKRNIHSLKSGYSLSVGGGRGDDYLIFLVPMPAHLGEIKRNGSSLTFIPRKPKYFPDIGSGEVRDCINKTIRIVSDKNYEMRFRFEMYEDPLIALNRMLMSVKVPG